jgi:hypothetical protein
LRLPAKRFDAGDGESHVPEIRFRRSKFDANVGLAVARAAHGDYAAFKALRGVIVHEMKQLAHNDRLLERKKRSMTIHRLRMRLDAELFALGVFSMDGQGHS